GAVGAEESQALAAREREVHAVHRAAAAEHASEGGGLHEGDRPVGAVTRVGGAGRADRTPAHALVIRVAIITEGYCPDAPHGTARRATALPASSGRERGRINDSALHELEQRVEPRDVEHLPHGARRVQEP